jgi:hypothetical protein
MKKRLLLMLLIMLLIVFPFLCGVLLTSFSPYQEGNTVTKYLITYLVLISIVSIILFYITFYFKKSFVQPIKPALILFFIGFIILGIVGLKSAPDLTIAMLKHPEREHFRYILLIIGALLYGLFSFDVLRNNFLNINGKLKWGITAIVLITFFEMIMEFRHHYFYAENLQKWINSGNNSHDFSDYYDNWIICTLGAIGRLLIYILIIWISIRLYRLKRTIIWNPILTTFLAVFGVISSIVMIFFFAFDIAAPPQFGFLMIFFIPGIPFLLLYWLGVGLLTKRPESINT